jgi:hypothetical protein
MDLLLLASDQKGVAIYDALDGISSADPVGVRIADFVKFKEFLDGWKVRLDTAETPEALGLLLETMDVGVLLDLYGYVGGP